MPRFSEEAPDPGEEEGWPLEGVSVPPYACAVNGMQKKGLAALEMHGELQGICLGAEGDPLGIHGGSAPKSGDPAISRLLAHEF